MSSNFIIRVASIEDEQSVTALLQASYPVLMRTAYSEAMLSTALPAMTKANPTLLLSGTFYLAETANKAVIGCGGWTREQPGSAKVESGLGHIRHFATHPDWIGKSVGRTIYQMCEREALKANLNCWECYSSLNAEGFYSALGFKSVEKIDIPINGNQFTIIRMRRFLEHYR